MMPHAGAGRSPATHAKARGGSEQCTSQIKSFKNPFLRAGQLAAAETQAREAIRLRPGCAAAWNNPGLMLIQQGRVGEAAEAFEKALAIQPGLVEAQSDLSQIAWIMATSPDASVRNGTMAVELARQTDRLSGGKNPMIAAALAAALQQEIKLYEAGTPWRDVR